MNGVCMMWGGVCVQCICRGDVCVHNGKFWCMCVKCIGWVCVMWLQGCFEDIVVHVIPNLCLLKHMLYIFMK